ncbi:glycosyltransferase family 2 protein [Mycobacterium sp. C31M]
MSLAYRTAQSSDYDADAYFLFNDDIMLGANFTGFLRAFRDLDNGILVGAFLDPATASVTYSGFVSKGRLRPFSFHRPAIGKGYNPVDTFNGNLVAIPATVFDELGGLDTRYTHALGDIDLGLRAKRIGVQSYVYGDPVGECAKGRTLDERIRAAQLADRWKLLFGFPNGVGPYMRFVRVHGESMMLPLYLVHTVLQRLRKLFWRRVVQKRGS